MRAADNQISRSARIVIDPNSLEFGGIERQQYGKKGQVTRDRKEHGCFDIYLRRTHGFRTGTLARSKPDTSRVTTVSP